MDEVYQVEGWRRDFRVLVSRCSCLEGAMKGKCDPKTCYPSLYEFLYPDGGCPAKSEVSKFRAERRAVFKVRRKRGRRVKKGEKVSAAV
jgi:hypothetical protein